VRGGWKATINDRTRSDGATGCPDCNPPRQTQETDRALAGWRPTPAVAPQTGNCHLRKCTIVERDGKL
jgi:hypothetical protein